MNDRTAGLLGVFVVFGTYSVIVGLVPFFYFRYHRNIPLKRRVHKCQAVLAGVFMFLFVTVTTRLSIGLFSLIPLTLITFVNIRNIVVCDSCGRSIQPRWPFSWRWHHARCPERNPHRFH